MISENILTLNENLLLSNEMLSTRLIEKGVSASKSEGLFSLINKVSLIPTGAMLQEKTFDENGTFLPDEGYDGFNKVIISVPTSGADGTFWKLNEDKYIINSEGEKMCAEELYYGSTNTGIVRKSNVPYSKETPYDDYLYYNVYDMVGQTTLYGGYYPNIKSGMTINGELMNTQSTYTPKEYGLYEVGFTNACNTDKNFGGLKFSGNTRIKECVINLVPDTSFTSSPDNLYSGCTNLEKATILNCKQWSSSTTNILMTRCFSTCTNLKDVIISNNITEINGYAFEKCSSLSSVTFGNSITTIGGYAFEKCSSLSSVTLPDSLTKIGTYAFHDCSSLSSITIPNNVTSIGDFAFNGCSSLSGTFTFPTGVTKVSTSVLYATNVSRVVINNVESIGYGAFYNCSKLVRIDCYSPIAPTLGSNCFYGLPNSGIVNVPIGADYSSWQDVLSNWEIRQTLQV